MHNGLNKGEAKHTLSRAVFLNRLGELRDRSFENQRYRASGLTLVVAAIILWNTVYLDRAIQALRTIGQDIDETLLVHLSPLGWEHINLTGDYSCHQIGWLNKVSSGRSGCSAGLSIRFCPFREQIPDYAHALAFLAALLTEKRDTSRKLCDKPLSAP